MIPSMAVYWFAESSQVHRFLDFGYEHSTFNVTTQCLVWGGLQVGYDDLHPNETFQILSMLRIGEETSTTLLIIIIPCSWPRDMLIWKYCIKNHSVVSRMTKKKLTVCHSHTRRKSQYRSRIVLQCIRIWIYSASFCNIRHGIRQYHTLIRHFDFAITRCPVISKRDEDLLKSSTPVETQPTCTTIDEIWDSLVLCGREKSSDTELWLDGLLSIHSFGTIRGSQVVPNGSRHVFCNRP